MTITTPGPHGTREVPVEWTGKINAVTADPRARHRGARSRPWLARRLPRRRGVLMVSGSPMTSLVIRAHATTARISSTGSYRHRIGRMSAAAVEVLALSVVASRALLVGARADSPPGRPAVHSEDDT